MRFWMRFLFQATEEGLGNGIVPAVASAAHTRLQVMGRTETLEVVASILAALVAVDQNPLLGLTAPHRHQQRVQGQLPAQGGFH